LQTRATLKWRSVWSRYEKIFTKISNGSLDISNVVEAIFFKPFDTGYFWINNSNTWSGRGLRVGNFLCTMFARQPCPAALPGSLAWQPCLAALPGSLAWQPCLAALPGSLARQPCRNITSLITGRSPAELQAFLLHTFTGRRPKV
jgi:hypothetical protein